MNSTVFIAIIDYQTMMNWFIDNLIYSDYLYLAPCIKTRKFFEHKVLAYYRVDINQFWDYVDYYYLADLQSLEKVNSLSVKQFEDITQRARDIHLSFQQQIRKWLLTKKAYLVQQAS